MKFKILKLKKNQRYPICPECGESSIVGFTPPKAYLYPKDGTVHPDAYKLLGKPEYVDWERAHLYCCADNNCKFNTRFNQLTTPRTKEKQYLNHEENF